VLLPTLTLPKLTLAGLIVIWTVCGFTVRVAALLVTLPTVLMTTTVICAPLSELVVAGVV
jgi:hypothetical protein